MCRHVRGGLISNGFCFSRIHSYCSTYSALRSTNLSQRCSSFASPPYLRWRNHNLAVLLSDAQWHHRWRSPILGKGRKSNGAKVAMYGGWYKTEQARRQISTVVLALAYSPALSCWSSHCCMWARILNAPRLWYVQDCRQILGSHGTSCKHIPRHKQLPFADKRRQEARFLQSRIRTTARFHRHWRIRVTQRHFRAL